MRMPGFSNIYATSDGHNPFVGVQFTSSFGEAAAYSLDANGRLRVPTSTGATKFADVPQGATNIALQFDPTTSAGTISMCTVTNGILTCVTGANAILYVCI